MAATNTTSQFGWVSKTFHWLTALLILTIIPLGVLAHDAPFATSEELARKAWLFSAHKTLGVTIFFVALARILWALSQTRPGLLNDDNKLESLAAEVVHWLLYAALVIVPLTGWIHHAASTGFAPIWWPFGQGLPLVPKSEVVSALFSALHMTFEKILIAALFLHIAGALKHHFWDKDATLRRMIGTPEVSARPHRMNWIAPLLALIIYGAVGTAVILSPAAPSQATEVAELEAQESDWIVQDGRIGITVRQFGAEVTGEFSEWTAAIAFTPDQADAGDVTVDIAIGSLTLGSVTAQALGMDYFDANQFPTAQFTAQLIQENGAYRAEGTLTLKGQTVPVSFPFDLTLDGDTATVAANTTVQRLDFGIGANQNDEATLGFAVQIDLNVTAKRAE